MIKYYNAFLNEISWFNHKKEPIDVFEIEKFKLTQKFQDTFPVMTQLINRSAKTGVEYNGKSMILFCWEVDKEISGWMCQFDKPIVSLIDEHKLVIDNIGGIIESFNGPESIEVNGINYNYTLTLNQDFMFVGSMNTDKLDWEDYYVDRCEELGVKPIDLTNSVFFSKEANGAKYFYDRRTKEVKLFSHDHAFRFVEFLTNQPEYTMHKINGVNNFVDFVELIAKQWSEYLKTRKRGSR